MKIMKKIKRVLVSAGICCMGLWIAGCTDDGTAGYPENDYSSYMAGSMEDAPVVDYLVVQQRPNILTDRRGYSVGDVKKAFVTGRQLPKTFTLVNGKTGETAYYGTIEGKSYNAELALYVGYADFSSVNEPGSYYMECDKIGQSYRFGIREKFYQELFQEAYDEILKDCGNGSLSILGAVRLLEVYEWYGELFLDQNRNNTPDVLEKLQGWVTYMEENSAGAGQEALYAAFLAKLSYNCKNYNYPYAAECLKRAADVFGQAPDAGGRDADAFYALTELFRATGLNTYHSRILEYKDIFEDNETYLEESYLYGGMTYLMTRQKVDAELCENFMYTIMGKAELISEQYQNMIAPAPFGGNASASSGGIDSSAFGGGAPADLMKYISELSCANFIMNIYQYTNMIEECLHYLMGRNMESVNFYERDGDRTAYLLWFAQMASAHEDMMGAN